MGESLAVYKVWAGDLSVAGREEHPPCLSEIVFHFLII